MGAAAEQPVRRDRSPLPDHPSPPTAPDATSAAAIARMADQIDLGRLKSGADALRQLRKAFPDSPLALRVAALNMLMRRERGAMPRPR
jgi:hypothetical protein